LTPKPETPMTNDLLDLEELGWQALSSPDPVPFCEQWLADDALIVVPGMVIDRGTFLRALAGEEPWDSHRIEDAHTVRLTDQAAAVVYRVIAQRGDQHPFVGYFTSVYVMRAERWQLALHQQTPMPATS
jgi:hypothetical protein